MACEGVSKKNSAVSRNRANSLISKVRKDIKSKYKFTTRLVGSASRNTIIKDQNGSYDLDYQILLTHNSKGSLKAKDIKKEFLKVFNKNKNEQETIYDSTTAITLIDSFHNFSIDFVILKILNDPGLIIRRSNNTNNPTVNNYIWNELAQINQAYDKFDEMSNTRKKDVCDNHIIPRKCTEKQKDESMRVSSMRIFIEEVNNYEC